MNTNCTEIVLTGKRCAEATTASPVSGSMDYCYYHGKVHDGLTGPAEAIGAIEDDDD